jgi:hypothetical protein
MSEGAKTWEGFLEQIREARRNLGNPALVWFRGQAKESYELLPSLMRHTEGKAKEQILFNEYERSASYLQGKKSDWEMLNDMQHYGIPTRLLDWTEVLGIAIAFALFDSRDDSYDSAIYLLDPVALNKLSGVSGVKRAPNEKDFSYKSVYWEGKPFHPNFPIAIDSSLHNERMRAQNGSFTVQGLDDRPLDLQAPGLVQKVTLGSGVKPAAREFLEHANLHPFSIYPDVVGMARHIVRKHLNP